MIFCFVVFFYSRFFTSSTDDMEPSEVRHLLLSFFPPSSSYWTTGIRRGPFVRLKRTLIGLPATGVVVTEEPVVKKKKKRVEDDDDRRTTTTPCYLCGDAQSSHRHRHHPLLKSDDCLGLFKRLVVVLGEDGGTPAFCFCQDCSHVVMGMWDLEERIKSLKEQLSDLVVTLKFAMKMKRQRQVSEEEDDDDVAPNRTFGTTDDHDNSSEDVSFGRDTQLESDEECINNNLVNDLIVKEGWVELETLEDGGGDTWTGRVDSDCEGGAIALNKKTDRRKRVRRILSDFDDNEDEDTNSPLLHPPPVGSSIVSSESKGNKLQLDDNQSPPPSPALSDLSSSSSSCSTCSSSSCSTCSSRSLDKKSSLRSRSPSTQSSSSSKSSIMGPAPRKRYDRFRSYCGFCDKHFISLRNYIQHKQTPSHRREVEQKYAEDKTIDVEKEAPLPSLPEKYFYCKYCNIQFTTKKSYNRHKYTQKHRFAVEEKVRSEGIELNIDEEAPLKVVEEQRFVCDQCGVMCKGNNRYKKHLQSHDPNRERFQCHVCDKSYVTKNTLREHILIHHDVNSAVCEVCGKCLPTSARLAHHIKKFHETRKKFTCQDCGKTFYYKNQLKTHQRMHRPMEDRVKCVACVLEFTSEKKKLDHDKQVHQGKTLLPCPHCPKLFSLPHILKQHLRVHTGEKPNVCGICNKGFAYKHHLRRHLTEVCGRKVLLDKC